MTEFEKAMSDNKFVMLTWNNNSGFTAVNTSGRLFYSFYLAGPWLDVQTDTINNNFTQPTVEFKLEPDNEYMYAIGSRAGEYCYGPIKSLHDILCVDGETIESENEYKRMYLFRLINMSSTNEPVYGSPIATHVWSAVGMNWRAL